MYDIGQFLMTTNFATSNDPKRGAFHPGKYATVADAWRYGLVKQYWRHGITINLGNGMNVSREEAKRRLNYIRLRLLKAMFGNNFRRKNAKINFLLFEQGSRLCFNQHHHALMAIEGDHNWSDHQIAETISEIECNRSKRPWENDVYVDFDWKNGNRFHGYAARVSGARTTVRVQARARRYREALPRHHRRWCHQYHFRTQEPGTAR
jgi:hypothetical protein